MNPIVTFTSRREAEKLAKEIGGSVVEYIEVEEAVKRIHPEMLGAFDDGFKLGYEQAKAEDGRHA